MSLNLLAALINHKGTGGLFESLKSLDLITAVSFSLNSQIISAFRFFTVSLTLTENGLKNYKKTFALVLDFFDVVKTEWLNEGPLSLFTEC